MNGDAVRTIATAALFTAAAALLAPAGSSAQGSNLGSYATQFVPGAISGKVTSGGVPVAGARVETIDGHLATTNASGDYVLYVDATGLYTVRVTTASRVAGPVQTSVALGATTTLNFSTLRVRPRPRRNLPASPSPPPFGPQP
jgi:hypothetical protein